MVVKRLILFFLSVYSFSCLFSQSYSSRIGFVVSNLSSGKTIFEDNADMIFTPASVIKLITTSTALEILGEDFKFNTDIIINGEIHRERLEGDLIIKGGGDPTLCSKYFNDVNFFSYLCVAIKKLGITEIDGNLLGDVSIFDKNPFPQDWTLPDLGNYYAAGVYGLSFSDNILYVTFSSKSSGTKPKIIDISPKIDGIEIDNRLISKKGAGDNAFFSGSPYSNNRKITGQIEANIPQFIVKADIGDPTIVLLNAIRDTLSKNGISIKGDIKVVYKHRKDTKGDISILKWQSPPLFDVIKNTNTYSNNMFAEHIFKYLSSNDMAQGKFSRSIEMVKLFWQQRIDNGSKIEIHDGSGLSVTNKITPNFLNDILIYMYNNSRYWSAFINSLPMAGNNGTVRNFMKNSSFGGKIFIKSGSMQGVQCYAGYITLGEKIYSIVIMVNDFSIERKEIVKQIENLIFDITQKL